MKRETDDNLVKQAIQGRSEAVAELFRRYWRAARATAYSITANLNMSEDVASEAFCTALQGLQNLKDPNRFGPWLHTIVVRTAKRHKKKLSFHQNIDISSLPDVQFLSPDENLEKREFVVLTHEAVSGLSNTLREAISLFYFEGYHIEEAAAFLDIPAGTFKRRLHDGRRSLHHVIEQILRGNKPLNEKREKVLRQFNQLINQGPDAVDAHPIILKVLQLRPLPYELMTKYIQKHSKVAKKMATPEGRKEIESKAQQIMAYICRPSLKVQDSTHAVGKVVQAIRKALPQFQEWQLDPAFAAQSLTQRFAADNNTSPYQPPGFLEGIPGSYFYTTKSLLIQNPDGSYSSAYEHLENNSTTSKQVISDVLVLTWVQSGIIELQSVEKLLRQLSNTIIPEIPVRFLAFHEPFYRSALRMQFETVSVPAAVGGPTNHRPNMPEGVSAANIKIFLESWASAQTGEPTEFDEMTSVMNILKNPNSSREK